VSLPDWVDIFPDEGAISPALASLVSLAAERAVGERGRFIVALSGGSLMELLGRGLLAEPRRSRMSWASWEVFWADERCVPLSSPESNFAAAHELLLKHVGLPRDRIHSIEDSLGPREAAEAYQAEMERVLQPGPGQPPGFDLVLLGMGRDGHTASLFPGHEVLRERQKWVAPVFNAPKSPRERITLTLPVINHAREVVFVAAGAEKAPALRAVFRDGDRGRDLPAALVHPGNGRLRWLVDEAAAELCR